LVPVSRFGGLQQLLEQSLFLQRIHVIQGSHLGLALHQSEQRSLNGFDVAGSVQLLPQHQVLPRIASTNCSTVISPCIRVICSAGMPPVIRLGVRMKCLIHSSSPPVRACSARARRISSKASSPCLLVGSSAWLCLRRLTAVRWIPSTSPSSACRRPSCAAARSTALASTDSAEGAKRSAVCMTFS